MQEHGAIQEMDEDYESTDMEDEDELNHRIQTKSTESPQQIDIDYLRRSKTVPYNEQLPASYKLRQKQKKHKQHKDPSIKKSKSYKQDDHMDDIDVQSVEEDVKPTKSSSTFDVFKNGVLNAKKRLLSADRMDYDENNSHSNKDKDSPYSPYSPTTPTTETTNQSPQSLYSNKSESPPHKKSSIFSKGKGLFRRESNKDIQTDSDDQKIASKHNKSASKSNLSNLKAKLQNMKNKAYGSQTSLQVNVSYAILRKV